VQLLAGHEAVLHHQEHAGAGFILSPRFFEHQREQRLQPAAVGADAIADPRLKCELDASNFGTASDWFSIPFGEIDEPVLGSRQPVGFSVSMYRFRCIAWAAELRRRNPCLE